MFFKRKAYEKLREWKEKYADCYSILLEGPRRVGKSTIAEQFAKNEYETYITDMSGMCVVLDIIRKRHQAPFPAFHTRPGGECKEDDGKRSGTAKRVEGNPKESR